jgi:hypothetical protein
VEKGPKGQKHASGDAILTLGVLRDLGFQKVLGGAFQVRRRKGRLHTSTTTSVAEKSIFAITAITTITATRPYTTTTASNLLASK